MTIKELNGKTYITEGNITIEVNATKSEIENDLEKYQTKLNNLKGAI